MASSEPSTAPSSAEDWILGVDVGGTFTDGILVGARSGEVRRAKVPTTPEDQSVGTLQTLPGVDLEPSELAKFCHGTTVGINALLQRRGANVLAFCIYQRANDGMLAVFGRVYRHGLIACDACKAAKT